MARAFHLRLRLRRILASLDPAVLSADGLELTEADVGLDGSPRTHLAFGIYSRDGFLRALTAYGLLDRLAQRGLARVELRLELDDPFHPRFVLFCPDYGAPAVDLTCSRTQGGAIGLTGAEAKAELLFVDSIQLQHPGRAFSWSRPPLPGQERPGLSLFSEIMELLALVAHRLGAQGIALVPSSFHAAWIYEHYFRFVEGAAQGRFEALRFTLTLRPLWLLAWAIALGCVRGPGGAPYAFAPAPMLCPLTNAMGDLFERPPYLEADRREAGGSYAIDWALLRERFPWSKMPAGPTPARIRSLLGIRSDEGAAAVE